MTGWREIRSLPVEEQARATAAVERRSGRPFRPAQPARRTCAPPVELLVVVTSAITVCHLCSDDVDDRARAVLAWLRTHSATVRLLACELSLELADTRDLVRRLASAGLVVCIGHIGEDTDGGLQAVVVWRAP